MTWQPNYVYAVLYKRFDSGFPRPKAELGPDAVRAPRVSAFPLHGQRDGAAIEFAPRDFDRIDDPGGEIDQDGRAHADLERSRSDDSGFLKSSVAHRGAPRQAAGEGGLKRQGRPYGARIGYPYFNLAQRCGFLGPLCGRGPQSGPFSRISLDFEAFAFTGLFRSSKQ